MFCFLVSKTKNMEIVELKTPRTLLRQWKAEDFKPFAALNADPKVNEFYPSVLETDRSNSIADRFKSLIEENGWGFWAVELIEEKRFIGFVGLNRPDYELPVKPCLEVGWRLATQYWGRGLATEAATEAINYGFNSLEDEQIYAFTSVSNKRSRAVMERLGMQNMQSNFNHPMLAECPALIEHVLYKVNKKDWLPSKITQNHK